MRLLAVLIILLACSKRSVPPMPPAPPSSGWAKPVRTDQEDFLAKPRPTDQDLQAAQKEIRRGVPEIKGCFEKELPRHPMLSGKVVVHSIIDQAGRPTNVEIETNTTGNTAVAECMGGTVARWSFPPPQNGPVGIFFPYFFPASHDATDHH